MSASPESAVDSAGQTTAEPSIDTVAVLPEARRRARLRRLLLVAVGLTWLLLGLAFAAAQVSTTLGVVLMVEGVGLLVVLALGPRVPEPLALALLGVVTLSLPVVGPIAAGGAGVGVFFAGVLSLLVLATAPRSWLWQALVVPPVILVATWVSTSSVFNLSDESRQVWIGILVSAVALIAATLVVMLILLQLSDASMDDFHRAQATAEERAGELAVENDELERLVAERTAELSTAVRQRDELAADLREASSVDPGSGLPNQRRWESQLPVMVAQAREKSMLLCVVVIDLDTFSEVNLRHGHLVGDEVIRRVARRLLDMAAPGTLVSRIGGEEFALAITGIDQRLAFERCRLLQAAVSAESWGEVAEGLAPTFSAGVVEIAPDAVGDVSSVARLAVHRADLAMQRAKREGRNRIIAGESP